jgi:hypothetical protein
VLRRSIGTQASPSARGCKLSFTALSAEIIGVILRKMQA